MAERSLLSPRTFLLVLLLVATTTPRLAIAANPPNVVFVLTDDQGYGDLSCHGNPVLKTPCLDRLARESIRFTDFHVAPMCTPTRAELMTGRSALANGAYCACSGRTFLRREMPTMPEIFSNAGYETALFGKWHLGDNCPHRPEDRGFAYTVYHLGWGITSTPDYWANDYFDDFFRINGRTQQFPGYCTDVWFQQAERWIRDCHRQGKPFFAYLSSNAPHGPFYAPEKYKKPYADLNKDTRGFFAMIANLDENMAKLDSLLKELALRENTIFIFMTDNGGTGGIEVFNAGMRGAKASYYEGGHRVPFFLRWPGGKLRQPGKIEALTHSTDILPTLIDLCGLKSPANAQLEGTSLAPLLRGKDQPELAERMAVVQYGRLDPATPQPWDSAVLWNKWRLVAGKELYDVSKDPGQEKDVAADHPQVVARMRDHYQRWWDSIRSGLTDFERLTIGSDQENPARLTSLDWLADKLVPAAQPFDIRGLGVPVVEGSLPGGRPMPVMNGFWNVEVEQAGRYRIQLRRWPRETDAAITASLPAYRGIDGTYPEGKALSAAQARLKVGNVDVARPVREGDKAVEFLVDLEAGKTHLQTWFLDAHGTKLCGAFYVEVLRLSVSESSSGPSSRGEENEHAQIRLPSPLSHHRSHLPTPFPKESHEMQNVPWAKEFPGDITVCDADGVILELNDGAAETFVKDGGRDLVGTNLLDCHPEPSRTKVKELLATGKVNACIIEKNGAKKLVYQAVGGEAGADAANFLRGRVGDDQGECVRTRLR